MMEEGGRKRQTNKQTPSCPKFTYIIFHWLLWRVELLMVGPATLGVNQSARQHMYCESGCLEIPLYSKGLWNDKQRQGRMEDFNQQRPQLARHTRKITGCLAEDSYRYPSVRGLGLGLGFKNVFCLAQA